MFSRTSPAPQKEELMKMDVLVLQEEEDDEDAVRQMKVEVLEEEDRK
jgi:hypothetical protein